MNWREINDKDVRAIWRCTEEDCDCDKEDCAIEPDWYLQNGTPMCEGDRDMSYIKTEISEDANEEPCSFCGEYCFHGQGCDEWQAGGFKEVNNG